MDKNERLKIANRVVTEDYNTMRDMLSEIELKLIGVDPHKQQEFYKPLKHIIFEAWQDACNPNDSFLFPGQNHQHT